jgi:hypothetical protein
MKKVIRLTESDLKRIVRRVLNEDVDPTTPTGVADSSGYFLTLDKNSSLGILDGGEYRLWNTSPVFKNYNTTKKIPNGVEYHLQVSKTIDGFNVRISTSERLTIKDGKLINTTWEDLFSKFNKISLNGPNRLTSDQNDIFQSLLKNEVPCFEIDKEKTQFITLDVKTGTVEDIQLDLKSKCDEKITSCYFLLDSSDGDVWANMNGEDVNVIWNGKDLKFEKSLDGTSNLIIVEPPNDEVIPKPNDEVIPKPNDKVIPKPTPNNNNTPPTGVVDSDSNFVLDENVSLGILGDGEYVLYGNPLEYDGKTKKIPDGSGYYLKLIKILNGYKVSINNNEALTIKDGILNGTTWGDLFSKINYVSLDTNKNELLSWEDDIFESLLENDVPCFEIDKEKEHMVFYGVKTGIINTVILYLKSTCDKKITSVRLILDKFDKVDALVNGKRVNTIWDGKKLEFKKNKNQELIIKVNENVRKVLRTYFYG